MAKPRSLIMGEPDEDPTRYFYLVRHGSTSMNEQHLMRGWDDPVLSPEGRQDARDASKAMKDVTLDAVYSSSLRRALETAKTIKPDGVVILDDLMTIDVGVWTGKPVEEVEPRLARLQAEWETEPGKSCPGGESWDEFQGRQLRAWKVILASDGKRTLVVSHLRCCVWTLGWVMLGMKPLRGTDIRILNRITQQPGRITTLSYSVLEGMKILGVNAQEVEG